MKWYIPREHGAWAMLIVPYWIGASISGIQLSHLLFFLGIFSIYFAQAPFLTYVRNPKRKDVWPSFFVYLIIGSFFAVPFIISNLVLLWIGLCIFPLFLLNIYFAKTKRERWFINDLIAIVALSSLMLIAYRLTEPVFQREIFIHLFISVLYFTSTVFHVKALIREKKNSLFQKLSVGYHFAIVFVSLLLNWYGAALAFVISLIKILFLPKNYLKGSKKIGIVEIINTLLFFIFIIGDYYL